MQAQAAIGNDERMHELVPTDDVPDGLSALKRFVVDGCSIRAAVAFVTPAGVAALADVLNGKQDVDLEIVARAADATDPDALLALRDELGVAVSVAIGRDATRFHPKLWLVEVGDMLHVLSGSGNLTRSGMGGNDEQWECYSVAIGGPEAEAQQERFARLTMRAKSLDAVEGSAIWLEWLNVIKAQRALRKELVRLQRSLDEREPIPDRFADLARLVADLDELYVRTVAAKLPREDGGNYVPSRFRQAIERARAGADPVALVTRICRTQSRGFDVLLNADRADLTVEQLVLDGKRPYHDLFKEETKRLSAARLQLFPSWRTSSKSPVAAPSRSSTAASGGRYATTNVTEKDIKAGQIRIPISGPTKRLFPDGRQDIEVVLRGQQLTCRWDPRVGPDRERLGLIRVGVAAARDLLVAGDVLTVAIVSGAYHLD